MATLHPYGWRERKKRLSTVTLFHNYAKDHEPSKNEVVHRSVLWCHGYAKNSDPQGAKPKSRKMIVKRPIIPSDKPWLALDYIEAKPKKEPWSREESECIMEIASQTSVHNTSFWKDCARSLNYVFSTVRTGNSCRIHYWVMEMDKKMKSESSRGSLAPSKAIADSVSESSAEEPDLSDLVPACAHIPSDTPTLQQQPAQTSTAKQDSDSAGSSRVRLEATATYPAELTAPVHALRSLVDTDTIQDETVLRRCRLFRPAPKDTPWTIERFVRRIGWTPEETEYLIFLASQRPIHNNAFWRDCSKSFNEKFTTNRSDSSCRFHYMRAKERRYSESSTSQAGTCSLPDGVSST